MLEFKKIIINFSHIFKSKIQVEDKTENINVKLLGALSFLGLIWLRFRVVLL